MYSYGDTAVELSSWWWDIKSCRVWKTFEDCFVQWCFHAILLDDSVCNLTHCTISFFVLNSLKNITWRVSDRRASLVDNNSQTNIWLLPETAASLFLRNSRCTRSLQSESLECQILDFSLMTELVGKLNQTKQETDNEILSLLVTLLFSLIRIFLFNLNQTQSFFYKFFK